MAALRDGAYANLKITRSQTLSLSVVMRAYYPLASSLASGGGVTVTSRATTAPYASARAADPRPGVKWRRDAPGP